MPQSAQQSQDPLEKLKKIPEVKNIPDLHL